MVKSMTGYGRADATVHGRCLSVEIKSVNSRYFEYSARLPRSCGFLEDRLKKLVSAQVSRGKVELYLSVQNLEAGDVEIRANIPVAAGYRDALAAAAAELGVENDVTARVLARFPDIFMVTKATQDEEELSADVLATAGAALDKYNAMRTAEGENLAADIKTRIAALDTMRETVAQSSAGRAARYTEKLHERLKEILADTTIDEARILTEAALFADKTAVDEETVRLQSHLAQFLEILAAGGAVGRKLDFLTQELNRETNTIGSKCQEVDITRVVVDMKAEIEKIREQIQNLE